MSPISPIATEVNTVQPTLFPVEDQYTEPTGEDNLITAQCELHPEDYAALKQWVERHPNVNFSDALGDAIRHVIQPVQDWMSQLESNESDGRFYDPESV